MVRCRTTYAYTASSRFTMPFDSLLQPEKINAVKNEAIHSLANNRTFSGHKVS